MKQVKFRFVLKEHCQQTEKEIALWNAKPVKGTMKVHAVVGQGSNSILVGNVSCYCSDCLAGSNCLSWRKESTKPKETLPTPLFDKETQFDINQNDVTEGRQPVESETEEPAVTVAATNSVIQHDEFPYQISFMEKKKKMFAWPKTPDVLWCKTSDIVYTINEPKPSGKSKRLFIIDNDLWEKLDNL